MRTPGSSGVQTPCLGKALGFQALEGKLQRWRSSVFSMSMGTRIGSNCIKTELSRTVLKTLC